ncbi:hypothetical protein O3M35_005810 [Rhynocoris fuscipes]|uniref:Uncharacterized protein n=1 Tax=Rhynocoris fuscipes TaxID=488301 RepID=A0AAW1DKU2_9HEMI
MFIFGVLLLAKLVAKEDNGNNIKIGDKELSLRVVEGEEEKTFLEKQKAELMKKRIAAQRRKGMNKKGRGLTGVPLHLKPVVLC